MGSPRDPGDQAILDAHAAGSKHEALRLLHDRYRAQIYGHARRMVGDAHLAEDVMQDTLLQVFQSLHTVTESLPAWVRTVTKNRSLDAIKKRTRHDRRMADDESLALAADRAASAESRVAHTDDVRNLETCLDGLPPRTRAAILLRFHGDATFDEVADALGERPDSVRMRIKRALPRLRECLESKGSGHGR